jgi:hypothetical protein
MEYSKPEIAQLGAAIAVIQGGKQIGNPDHEVTPDEFESVAAYQADE